MKKIILILCCAGLLISCVIAKSNKKDDSKKAVSTPAKEKAVPAVNPELKKLNAVLLSMSDRFKGDFANGDPEEFLADLHKVLEAEKNFRDDDLSLYFLIDKKHSVGENYVPKDLVKLTKNQYYNISRNDLSLRPDVEAALEEMAKGARKDGITLLVSSTYRSYEYQKNLFQKWVRIDGLEEAERESAREGTSQHQLGVAIDFGSIDDSFINTSQGKWLNEHSEEYGWSLSFPQGYEDVTGFRWECWHFRYLGIEACKFQKKWFNNIQQYMIEFIDAWKNYEL